MSGERAELVACETCGGSERDAQGHTRGQRLLAELQQVNSERGDAGLQISSTRCLWACARSCAVLLRSERRVAYVLAGLAPSREVARALCDYAAAYRQSADGAVPYKSWPAPLKGHFLCRIPHQPEFEQPNPEPEQIMGPSKESLS